MEVCVCVSEVCQADAKTYEEEQKVKNSHENFEERR